MNDINKLHKEILWKINGKLFNYVFMSVAEFKALLLEIKEMIEEYKRLNK